MIPEIDIDDIEEMDTGQTETEDKTYYINFDKNRIQGEIDGLQAVRQSVICMLETERYAYLIHTWQYGASLEHYVGKSYDYVTADIGREITETLMTDDRILEVDGFEFEQIEDNLKISFNVNTVYGMIEESVVI